MTSFFQALRRRLLLQQLLLWQPSLCRLSCLKRGVMSHGSLPASFVSLLKSARRPPSTNRQRLRRPHHAFCLLLQPVHIQNGRKTTANTKQLHLITNYDGRKTTTNTKQLHLITNYNPPFHQSESLLWLHLSFLQRPVHIHDGHKTTACLAHKTACAHTRWTQNNSQHNTIPENTNYNPPFRRSLR